MPPVEGMNPEFARRLTQLINASGGSVYIVSGYRSEAEQARLWNAKVAEVGEAEARKWVAPPGKSNHGRGLAADLAGDLAWAHANAATFGLYFPMSWEEWHIEMTDISGIEPVGSGSAGQYDPALGWTDPEPALVDPVADVITALTYAFANPSVVDALGQGAVPETSLSDDAGAPLMTSDTSLSGTDMSLSESAPTATDEIVAPDFSAVGIPPNAVEEPAGEPAEEPAMETEEAGEPSG